MNQNGDLFDEEDKRFADSPPIDLGEMVVRTMTQLLVVVLSGVFFGGLTFAVQRFLWGYTQVQAMDSGLTWVVGTIASIAVTIHYVSQIKIDQILNS